MTRRPGIEPEEKSLAELFDPIAWERRVAEARERRERALSERKGTDEEAEAPRGARIRMVDLAEDAPETSIREERLGAPEPAAPPAPEPAPAPAAVTAQPGRDGTARLIQALDGVSRRQTKPAAPQEPAPHRRPVAGLPPEPEPEPVLPAAAPPAPPVLPGAERAEAVAAAPAPAAPRRSPQMLAVMFAAGAIAGGLIAFWLVRANHEAAPQTATPDVEVSAADSAADPAAAPGPFLSDAPELAVTTSPADIAPPRIPTPPDDRGFTSASGRAERPGNIHDPDSLGLTRVPDFADFPAARPPALPATPETAAVQPEPSADEAEPETAATEEPPAAAEDTAAAPEPETAPEEDTAAAVPVGATRVFLHVPRGVPVAETEAITASLSGAGFGVQPAIRMNLNVSTSNVRYFHAADLENARALAAALGANLPEAPVVRDFTYLQTPARPGTLEVWLAGSGSGTAARSTGTATRQQQPAAAPQQAPEAAPTSPAPTVQAAPQATPPADNGLPPAVPAGRLRSLVETVQGR